MPWLCGRGGTGECVVGVVGHGFGVVDDECAWGLVVEVGDCDACVWDDGTCFDAELLVFDGVGLGVSEWEGGYEY